MPYLGLNVSSVRPIEQEREPNKNEREVIHKVPSHLPLRVRFKNLAKVKDLENENWLSDFEVEVTNTGTKPIYFLYMSLSLDTKHDDGVGIGYQLRYGRAALADLATPIVSDDVPIGPGETYTFRVPPNSAEGWKLFENRRKVPPPQKIELKFQVLNFGDGTGFAGADGTPLPNRKSSSQVPCAGELSVGRAELAAARTSSPPDLNALNWGRSSAVNYPAHDLPFGSKA